ncbi:restriction endonuclease subunit S [Vibrio parahaemolyticus]|uniref:restriction endonuclease subunit S n=1 Tax=Vibrio parahaemolyticus TaxID=670 RepID=UPI001B835312|nr:restriction endonuclease subunit S [Vibrio parahaemolyticus]MCC3830253.1 restriction endonuclease subunit S [Vibrio parahaemolyticus]HBC3510792.1 restriction endonuclease subunit S [Vibrio parahaemolyticus]HBH7854738.1 restriction endonuclease subunit S [Vibrio parahaemolyticus]
MTGRYKAYPDYKKSGVEWLGDVPENWSVHSLKRTVDNVTNGIWGSEPDGENDLIVIRVADFNRNQLNISDDKLTFRSIENKDRKTRLLKKGDLLIEKSGGGDKTLVGCVVLFDKDYEAVTSNFVAKMTPQQGFDSSFLRYAFSYLYAGKVNYSSIKQTTGIQNLDSEAYLLEKLAFPLYEEQQKIANFLDHETAKIDTLITKQEKLIELLKEKRQAVISHAVTKGLNPDVQMKDSGVEWLGEVPAHWEVLPTKRFFRLVAEPSTKNHGKELLSVYAAIGVAPRKDLEQKGNKASNTDGYWSVKKGDIIVNKLLAWMGAVGYSDYDGVTSPAYDILRKTKDINPKFYHFLFRQEFTQSEFKRWSRGIMEMRLRLYFEELGRIMMPVPPKNEQDKIVAEIESMNATFVKIEDKATKQIELMKERKTALISAAVTGKIDVRDWQESA